MAGKRSASAALKLPLLLAAAGMAFGVPSAGLAVVAFGDEAAIADLPSFAMFTPASADPELAKRVAEQARNSGMRFTPAGSAIKRDRTITVAVRVDPETARAISVRQALDVAPGATNALKAQAVTRYDLGTARGYQSFKRPQPQVSLSGTVRDISMPDLSAFEPAGPTAEDKPSRFQTRIALEDEQAAGRSPNTLDALSAQTVDLGGAYSITRNLDVTAGVRLSQERDRLSPITDNKQDSQSVYVGTQFRF
ncbi:hypothetical protein [Altererythrobacter sp.]|uniref:hypothetical protein n=1 Tax=Altererythrobacter sp. TaxID=1872480 RepID=UPI001B0493A8|nr:hypothetical protein [Altererythrobacter sp.]MBO6944800.1 hypothetical protein [Altererythrobacter sp.]